MVQYSTGQDRTVSGFSCAILFKREGDTIQACLQILILVWFFLEDRSRNKNSISGVFNSGIRACSLVSLLFSHGVFPALKNVSGLCLSPGKVP